MGCPLRPARRRRAQAPDPRRSPRRESSPDGRDRSSRQARRRHRRRRLRLSRFRAGPAEASSHPALLRRRRDLLNGLIGPPGERRACPVTALAAGETPADAGGSRSGRLVARPPTTDGVPPVDELVGVWAVGAGMTCCSATPADDGVSGCDVALADASLAWPPTAEVRARAQAQASVVTSRPEAAGASRPGAQGLRPLRDVRRVTRCRRPKGGTVDPVVPSLAPQPRPRDTLRRGGFRRTRSADGQGVTGRQAGQLELSAHG